ncbi:MAG: ribonuclease HII [Trueperaceae bacterium]
MSKASDGLAMPVPEPSWSLEAELWARGCTPVAGVDEAGRGALAGPVVAAAVMLPLGAHPYRDSKTLPALRREELADLIRRKALAWGVGVAAPREIDEVNVLRATHLAAARALSQLRRTFSPAGLVTDYLWLEDPAEVLPVPQADCRSFQAAAAGVLAKVTRDALMRELAVRHPGYGFEQNKGYGAPAHLEALEALGPCNSHRMSFRPITRLVVAPA